MPTQFYNQPKPVRDQIVVEMRKHIQEGLINQENKELLNYAANSDTHIRKWAYIILGRMYKEHSSLRNQIISVIRLMIKNPEHRIRQTAVYAAGEIGNMNQIKDILELGLKDSHHSVRNGIIGALKVMGVRNPKPVLKFAQMHIHDDDPEVRRQVIHGIELWGRTHPQDILPILRKMQNEKNKRVFKMISHVLGQISYKKGCLETVVTELSKWENQTLVKDAIESILSVHKEQSYCFYSYEEAKNYIKIILNRKNLPS